MDGTPGDKALPAAGRGKPVGRGAKMRAVARGDHLDQRQAQINASQVGNYRAANGPVRCGPAISIFRSLHF